MHPTRQFLGSGDAGLGWAFGSSRTGASHIRSSRPSEDAFALWSGASGALPCIAAAVADGHGDSRHDQSRAGAALAVHAAIDELVSFHRVHGEIGSPVLLRSEFRSDFPRRVTRRWRETVTDDAERRQIDLAREDGTGSMEFTRYGTTLIATLVLKDTILVGQIGDGDVVLVRPDGTLDTPIPADTTLMGAETRSLSSRDAHLLWRTATLDRGSGGVLIAATDGVSDSFDGSEGEEFRKFVTSLATRIRDFGIESVADSLSGWLDRYSELGSGDDMTMVFVCINSAEESDAAGTAPVPGEPRGDAGPEKNTLSAVW
jgi:serine/threonine protein phosphatase PrpC